MPGDASGAELLKPLRTVLQGQVDAAKSISVSEQTVKAAGLVPRQGFDRTLRGSFALGKSDLSVQFSGTVPEESADGTLTLTGSASLLGVSVDAEVRFQASGGEVDARLAAWLPAKWTLGKSFAALAGPPFEELLLESGCYVATTVAGEGFEWNGQKQTLVVGAQLFAVLTLADPPLSVLIPILDGGTASTLTLSGPVDPSQLDSPAVGLPKLELTAPIGHGVSLEGLELSEPRLRVFTVDGTSPSPPGAPPARYCWLTFATTLSVEGGRFCTLEAALPGGTPKALSLNFAPLSGGGGTSPGAEGINGLLGPGVDFEKAIPSEVKNSFSGLELRAVNAVIGLDGGPSVLEASVSVAARGEAWKEPPYFELEELALEATMMRGRGAPTDLLVSFRAKAHLFPAVFEGAFDVEVQYDTGEKRLDLIAQFAGALELGKLVEGLTDKAIRAPEGLDVAFTDFGAAYSRVGGDRDAAASYSSALWATADISISFFAASAPSSLEFLREAPAGGDPRYRLRGVLLLAESAFAIEVDLEEGTTKLSGSWKALGGDYLGLDDLIDCVTTPPRPTIPPSLDLNLDEAEIDFYPGEPLVALTAQSATWGKAAFAALRNKDGGNDWAHLGGVAIGKTIDLTALPLIGKGLAAVEKVVIEEIEAIHCSKLGPNTAMELAKYVAALRVPPQGVGGLLLAMKLQLGAEPVPLEVQLSKAQSELEGGEPAGATVWANVQKSIGALSLEKVGLRYADDRLWIVLNASLSGEVLTVSLFGLGLGTPLDTFEPKFTVEGLGVELSTEAVELSGALFGTLEPLAFAGEMSLRVAEVQIGALGAYREVEGHPSAFLYAVCDYPMGGPPFFFVTGMAVGFGFNRKLVVPPVEGVAAFPFVQWAAGEGNAPATGAGADAGAEVERVVGELESSGVVAPALGTDWGALGVRFTSFKALDGFALLTLVLGTQLEVALLGMATVSMPPESESPVAEAQLALEATFTPDTGLLAVSGQLTPQSYVLSPEAHLTGGFAFYSWVSGEHAGDFVLTLGGYSPRYQLPQHYPQVPRLGLAWQVSDELTVTGDLYFALTSSAVMAGGGMSAVWQSDGIRAWFEVEADFLLVFQPFHYYLSAGIHLGASFSIDLLFTSVTITIHLGVELEIWGPEFAGKATIDLSIISFTVEFGGSDPHTDTTIEWSQFLERLVPGAAAPAARLGEAAPSGPALVGIRVVEGLVKELSEVEGDLNWVVNGTRLRLETHSSIPIKTWAAKAEGELSVHLDESGTPPNTDIAVGPTGTTATEFESSCNIVVSSDENSEIVASWVLAAVPRAFWEQREFDEHGVPTGVDPVNGTTIPNALVGFSLAGKVEPPDHTLPVPLEYLQYTIDPDQPPFSWSTATAPAPSSFGKETVWETIEADGAVANRGALERAIAATGLAVPAASDVSELAGRAGDDLLASPQLRLLGERR